jgi:RHS repeat-associated protein
MLRSVTSKSAVQSDLNVSGADSRVSNGKPPHTASFKYDPFGRRIEKTTSSTTSIYAYSDNGNLIEETNAAGGVVARYSQGLNIDEPLAMLRSSTTSYYEADGLGAVTSLSNTAGALAQTYTFDSFGNTTASSGSLVNPFQYTGRELDSETGLYYFRARYFDPQAGRFLGEDPLGFSVDVNFYRYVGNSPTNFNDPLGLAKCEYSISQHTLVCTSNYSPPVGPTYYVTVGPNNVSSGNGDCKDNPKCADKQFTGPIKPGNYKMNPDTRQGQTDRYRLEPQPPIPGWKVRLFLERGGFELHPGHITLGCINVLKDDPNAMQQYQQLQQLLNSQTGSNFLTVVP